jgi:sporulation protein YlmC with PRC-barrel domain
MSKLSFRFGLLRLGCKTFRPASKSLAAASVLVAACLAAIRAAYGADSGTVPQVDTAEANETNLSEASLPFDAHRLGAIKAASDLIGEKVTDPDGKTLGKIRDLVLDVSSGGLVATLIDSGGKSSMAPGPAHSYAETLDGKPHLDMPRKLFQNAPHFAKTRFAGLPTPSDLSDSFSFFNQPAPQIRAAGAKFQTASSLRGQPILGRSGQTLGRLLDIVVDLPQGRVVFLVVQPAEILDPSGDLYLVPPASVQPDAAGQTLALNADAAHFLSGHHYPKQFPTAMNLPQVALAVYGHYGLLLPAPKHAAAPAPERASVQSLMSAL